jgi:PAT family acetyl-CoA transporter-like MFS transporter 1
MLRRLRQRPNHSHDLAFWLTIMASTAAQAICNSLQFNAQMIFFASRVDPAIGGSYMTLLNTAANLGGTWPASFVMWLLSVLTPTTRDISSTSSSSSFGRDPYVGLQILFAVLGIAWILGLGPKLKALAALPDDAWRTHLLDANGDTTINNNKYDLESGDVDVSGWNSSTATAKRE